MKYLFIDANIWLSVYHFTSDTLEKFEQLKELLAKDVKIIVPEQVYFEVLRNRDTKIKSSWETFKNFNFQIPAFCQSYSDYTVFKSKYDELQIIYGKWKNAIQQDIQNNSLKADLLLFNLFSKTKLHTITQEITKKAEIRYKSGNPPGKNNSLGDAINWEILLQFVPNGKDLYFIGTDKDYCSPLDSKKFNLFLQREWKNKKKSNIIFFRSLSDFFKDHIKSLPPISSSSSSSSSADVIEQEQKRKEFTEFAKVIEGVLENSEKQNAITLLRNSGSFANTHNAISLLSKYDSWTSEEIDELCDAALENDQVGTIIGDDDLDDFYTKILSQGNEQSTKIANLRNFIYGKNKSDDDSIIF